MINVARNASPVGNGPAIRQVSESLGIPAPTLRSWERRYGIPVTSRSSGGHRRYAEDELNQLRLMRDEVARGKRAGDAALAVMLLLDQSNPELLWINRMLAASEQASATKIRVVLDQARNELGLATTIDEVLMPVMRQIGAWWETGRCDLAKEHLMTDTARRWLARLTVLMPAVTYAPPIVLACGPRDEHTVGLEALAALLAEERRGCRVLGARTSELRLVTAVRATSAAAVVVVSQLHTQRRVAVDALRAVEQTGCPVFYAGNAFAFPSERQTVPGTYLGDSISMASTIIAESLRGAPDARVPVHAL